MVPFKSSGLYATDSKPKLFRESKGLLDGEQDLNDEDLSV
jgi:hypothetical protein